uniref:Retrotrans_gag domain-containing protein n=1 Tax=Caenorhabditis japonica TaxID=281687 RepID=A0A8R1IV98_CAEJA
MEHPAQLSCDSVTDKASITTLRNAVCKDLHAAHERITDVFEQIQVRVEKLEKEGATSVFVDAVDQREVTTLAGLRSAKHQVSSNSAKFHPSINNKEPQGNSASPQGEQPANQRVSDKSLAAAAFPGETSDIRKASAVARSKETGTEQSDPVTERDAQQPSVCVITQTDAKEAATSERTRGTRRSTSQTSRISRSTSQTRRITRAMSASQQPRINVFAMKSAATVPIFSGTNKENFHAFVRNFKDHVRLTNEPDDKEVRNHLLTVLTDFARDTAEEVLDRNPDATSEDIIDALRAQYEDQYSTQNRLDAIKACFQYAQEPVQDYYQRIRKLMREAQTGANRTEVTQVTKEAFRNGLQSEIRFYVTTARSTEFDQVYRDAIFYEKALQEKERKDRADAAAIASRPRTAEVFAHAAVRNQEQYFDYDNERNYYPAVAAFNQPPGSPGAMNNSPFDHGLQPKPEHQCKPRFWSQFRAGPKPQRRVLRAADIARGIYRNNMRTPHNMAPHPSRSRNAESRRPPLNPVENHRQPTVRVIQTSEPHDQSTSTVLQDAQARIGQQERMIKMQENQLNDIRWRLEAYQMGRSPGNSPPPSVNLATPTDPTPTVATVRQVSTLPITAQIPIRANGIPCYALIDTGSSITVTSENSKDTFCSTPLEPPQSSTALGLGGNQVNMVGTSVMKFQVGPFTVDHLTHFTEGKCTPTGPTGYTFIIGNDVLRQLPNFILDYAKGHFLIAGAILPMGNQQERDAYPGNRKSHLKGQNPFPRQDDTSTPTHFSSKMAPTVTLKRSKNRRSPKSIDIAPSAPRSQPPLTRQATKSTKTNHDELLHSLRKIRKKPVRSQN